jgi:peptidoglycan/xylan/chitin deacetylase (PgdA/CDA1 family)
MIEQLNNDTFMKKIILFLLMVPSFCYSQILKKEIDDKMVVLTFDDATASQYSVVAPLLKEYGFGATFFICEFQPNFSDSSKYMNWRQIRELNNMGFEVANHTQTHPNVGKLTKKQFLAELDYIENKFDSLSINKPATFAYPGYGISTSAINTLMEEGYLFARAGGSRAYDPLTDHPLLIPSWAMNSDNKEQIMKAFGEAENGKIVVLTIHGVPDVEHPWVNTPPELFKAYLQYLSENNFKVVSLGELENYIDAKMAMELIVPDFNKTLKN